VNNPIKFTDPFGLRVLNPNNYPVSDDVMLRLRIFNLYIGCQFDIVITSGYRSSGTGYHPKNLAADIYVPGQDHLTTANQAIRSGLFGGVGWYQEGWSDPSIPGSGPHAHVDIRDMPSYGPVVWGYDINSYYYNWESGGIPLISPTPSEGTCEGELCE